MLGKAFALAKAKHFPKNLVAFDQTKNCYSLTKLEGVTQTDRFTTNVSITFKPSFFRNKVVLVMFRHLFSKVFLSNVTSQIMAEYQKDLEITLGDLNQVSNKLV